MRNSVPSNPALAIGRSIDDPEVVSWLNSIDRQSRVREKPDTFGLSWISEPGGVEIMGHLGTRRITTVCLRTKDEDFEEYGGPLPHGLSFSMSRDAVRAVLEAPPDFTSEEHDAWDFDDHRLIVMYEDGAITEVS